MTQIYRLSQVKDQGLAMVYPQHRKVVVTVGHYGSKAEAEYAAKQLFPDPRERSFHTYIEVIKLDQVR